MSLTVKEWLHDEPFELYLGAGFFGFYAHVGFVKAIEEAGLKAKKIYGASAGAIVGAMLANDYSATDVEKIVLEIQRKDFWDPGLGFGLLKGKKYHELLLKYLPSSFGDLKLPFEVTVFDIFGLRFKNLSSGDLCAAVRGSSAFPGLFQPVKIQDKIFVDGGLFERFPQHKGRVLAHCFGKPHSVKQVDNRFVVSLKNIPRSGPAKMHLAEEIIQKAYWQTKKLLETSVTTVKA
jgi:NTE family protein